MGNANPLFKIYSSTASQWAGVPLLGLAEKGYPEGSYEVEDVDLLGAGNFHPDYVKINRNGTIPSLTSPSLPEPLIESSDILVYLNDSRPSGLDLSPKDDATSLKIEKLIDLVHSPQVSTNIILLDARDPEEMEAKQNSPFRDFLSQRQNTLESYCEQFPDSDFYKLRRDMNAAIYKHYVSSGNHQEFFKQSQDDYRGFAAGVDTLDSLLVLPYAAGPEVTLADLHIVPWLAHAMWGAGTKEIGDFGPLETVIRKTVPDFKIGPKTKQWWANMMERESFQKVFPYLH
ncbi:uncharacterized protein Z519_09101 [Cladophialophora bantiana CBS 173.52]|uniref:GST C-terminal domain-containing protein n=1 Tax=Cladophialophora bantiana (strain ATCC 10958 / CBS 173.52 / CDC B-1940 / NIH 8579) TaxID=1442370 RepID=A0A0D2HI64_CLAB1|nr:uncharacterized protein Z519_09101 [Cladophialophora bantiana CBS 173.52]KIW90455.1 hypothetical protein Z519_09101 [Cladophialophora bantiana CBS 173.52]